MPQRLAELRRYVHGWMGYFALAAHMRLIEKFDQWLRRRLRMCFWKRWRLVRTRVRNLRDLDSPPVGLPPCEESQGAMAHGEDHCQRCRDDERLAACPGTGIAGPTGSASSNRLVRTRTLRGVGAGRGNPPGYPIRLRHQTCQPQLSHVAVPLRAWLTRMRRSLGSGNRSRQLGRTSYHRHGGIHRTAREPYLRTRWV